MRLALLRKGKGSAAESYEHERISEEAPPSGCHLHPLRGHDSRQSFCVPRELQSNLLAAWSGAQLTGSEAVCCSMLIHDFTAATAGQEVEESAHILSGDEFYELLDLRCFS